MSLDLNLLCAGAQSLLILSHRCGCIYICLIRHCGALLTQPDRQGMTSVLLVGARASAVAGVLCWVWVAAVGFWAAAYLDVATGGYTMVAVGACCTASEVDRVVTDCLATSTLGCVSGWTASG